MGDHEHGDGLHEDLVRLASRRDALRIFGAAGAAAILGTAGASCASAATATGEVPGETAGPYPGDGSNGPDVLDDSGIVRHDIRRSFGARRTRATGVPLRVNLTVTDAGRDRAPLAGATVYLWHCDRQGRYSMYSSGVEDESYLGGIARADAQGTAWFRTVFPACYDGRWPHIHFEVYASVAKAVANGPIVKTSQIALPKRVCEKVYATGAYAGSAGNLARTSLSRDMVFGDDRASAQLARRVEEASQQNSCCQLLTRVIGCQRADDVVERCANRGQPRPSILVAHDAEDGYKSGDHGRSDRDR
jgi:protocatechuate 3,4-dioxygenase beta subunit